jgi:hypothetical protein
VVRVATGAGLAAATRVVRVAVRWTDRFAVAGGGASAAGAVLVSVVAAGSLGAGAGKSGVGAAGSIVTG